MKTHVTEKSSNPIPPLHRQKILTLNQKLDPLIVSLNDILSNEMALFVKTLNYHWNVCGPRFHSLHLFLDEQYHKLLKIVDDIAERIRSMDGRSLGTLKEFLSHETIEEKPDLLPSAQEMLMDLHVGHLLIEKQIKETITNSPSIGDDIGTEDFLIELIRKHEKMDWMIRSHLTH